MKKYFICDGPFEETPNGYERINPTSFILTGGEYLFQVPLRPESLNVLYQVAYAEGQNFPVNVKIHNWPR